MDRSEIAAAVTQHLAARDCDVVIDVDPPRVPRVGAGWVAMRDAQRVANTWQRSAEIVVVTAGKGDPATEARIGDGVLDALADSAFQGFWCSSARPAVIPSSGGDLWGLIITVQIA